MLACRRVNISCLYGPTDSHVGKLWKTGYDNGDLKTPLFDDVIPTLEAWKNAGKKLVVFSSGSVQAQLQFFSVVEDGSTTRDLKPLFAAHFDPTIAGSKLEKASYEKICKDLDQGAASVTFLTDNVLGKCLAVPLLLLPLPLTSGDYADEPRLRTSRYTMFLHETTPRDYSLKTTSMFY